MCLRICSFYVLKGLLLLHLGEVVQYFVLSLLPISGFVLDEKFQLKASKFAIFHIPIRKPKVAFSVFHFVLLYCFP